MQNLLYYFLCITLLLPAFVVKADDFQECENSIIRSSCCSDSSNCCDNSCINYKKAKAFCALFAKELQVKNSGFISNLTAQQLLVSGNKIINGNLTILGEFNAPVDTIEGDVHVTGNLSVGGTSTLTGAVTTGGDLTVGDDLTVTDNLTVNGSITFNVDGQASLEPNVQIAVFDTATFAATVRVGQAIYPDFSTDPGAPEEFLIVSPLITTTSAILFTVTTPNVFMVILGIRQSTGQLLVTVRNESAVQLVGDIVATFWILN